MWSLRRLFVMCILLVPAKMVLSQDCKFTWDNGTELAVDDFGIILETILDTEPTGTEILSVQAKNVVKITDINSGSSKKQYIKPELIDDRLTLKLTANFTEFEENEDAISITVRVTFSCAAGTSKIIRFDQPIKDTNNHPPVFVGDPYVFTLPMPFPKNIRLDYFQAISARDVDVTNSNVTFHLDETNPNANGFSVLWLSRDTVDTKRYHATLRTESVINFSEDVTFALYATDAGEPQRNSTPTLVTIKVDVANSILQFKKKLYIADLTNLKPEEADGKLIFASGEIGLAGGVDDTVTFAIHDDLTGYKKYFQPEASDDRSTVNVRLVNPPAELFLESFVVLRLTATKIAAEETTVLHISLPARANVPTPSTTPSSSPPTTDDPSGNECSSGKEECDNIDYIATIVILAILLVVTTVGLVVSLLMNRRIRRESDDAVRKAATNGGQQVVPEMIEIRNGSVSPNPSPSNPRKSVTFHGNEETKVARL